ncbi:MAG: preprotein translocase subunit YajC, partial [Spirochaetaceae bacterium]|nr:preprotein translocase subunit YajC [Spirochaetaceae bacterium]
MSFTQLLLQVDAAQGNALMMPITLVLIIVIFYFFMIRPENKKRKETEKMIAALKKGDKVVTIGGIHGVVSQPKENTIIVKVDDGTKIEFNRSAISTVLVDKKNDEKVVKMDKSEKT